ncbi:MAG: sialate O-acetylesterase [Verrucomicrobiota bacterium]
MFKHLFLWLSFATVASADIKLPPIISDHMVLRQGAESPIWGTAEPGESVIVKLAGQTVSTKADVGGRWKARLDLSNTGPGPFELTVSGSNTLTIHDVLVGEVWVSSGQSNMDFKLGRAENAEKAIAQSAYPRIRMFHVKPSLALPEPREECEGAWVVCDPKTSGDFTAVGYYFAKALVDELNVPVGLIHNAWGGTPIEAWTSYAALGQDPELKAGRDKALVEASQYPAKKKTYNEAFAQWLRDTGREDHAPVNVEAFAGMDVSTTDWEPLQMPGKVFGDGVAESGAVWVRGEVTLTPEMLKATFPIRVGSMEAFPTVYWNGEELKRDTFESYPGKGYVYRYYLRGKEQKVGRNVLAIRFYAPYGNGETVDIKCDFADFIGGLRIKQEYALPLLTAEQKASMPRALPNPLRKQDVATYLFNGMIAPILNYGITGVIWYQGESNVGRGYQYRRTFPLLIQDWRQQWGQGDFPFYFCQIANFGGKDTVPNTSSWAALRESQAQALNLPNTGMAVLIDLGEAQDIHPRNKADVGERLARIALAKTYGQDMEYSGPVYESMQVNGKTVELTFTHVGGGLVAKPVPATYTLSSLSKRSEPLIRNSPESELEGFALCGKEHHWVWANAKIEGGKVLVWSDAVDQPVAVRYNWGGNPNGNLYNAGGLPAVPFRTDDFPVSSQGKHY